MPFGRPVTAAFSPFAVLRFGVPAIFLACATAYGAIGPEADTYIAGHDAETGGKYADAITAYTNAAGASPELADFAKIRAAACRAKGGDPAGAEKLLHEIVKHSKDEPAALMARAELATLLARDGKRAEAAQLLERIFALPITPKWLAPYRQLYGDCLIASPDGKRRAKGYAVFVAMLAEARTRPQRLEAAERLAGSPEPDQRMQAVGVYTNAGEWADAAKALAAAEPMLGAAQKRHQAQIDYVRARIVLGTDSDKEKGRAALLSVAKTHSDTEWGRLALAYAARSYWSAGQEPKVKPKKEPAEEPKRRATYRDTAQKLFDVMTTKLADTDETGDALWWLANQYAERIEEPAQRDAALATYLQLVECCPKHERASDALYRAAILYDAKTDPKRARECQNKLLERYPGSNYAPGAAFECGRMAEAAKDRVNATAFYQQAIALGGVGSFYAHRASQCLAALGGAKSAQVRAIPAPGVGAYLASIEVPSGAVNSVAPGEAWLDRIRFFSSHGYEEAEWEALAHAPQLLNPEHAGAYLKALSDAGLAATVKSIIDETRWGMKDDRPLPEVLPILYPRAYWDTVQAVARETGGDPFLLLAIARQESLFQARIQSHAGAEGVMQLMPSTAAWIAKSEPSIGEGHADDLLRPASSVRVGAYYFRYILGKHGGNAVYAVASYNAGPGNVSKWRVRFSGDDFDRFIEGIPFDETRDFVKKVLGNYAAYYSIYGEDQRVAEVKSNVEGR